MRFNKLISIKKCKGYTFVELMVALGVSSIVIAGSYAGYSLLARQQQLLNAQTSVDRNTLRVIDLIQSDIRMAGYKDYQSPNTINPAQVVVISVNDLILVYDDYDASNMLYRVLIHYSLEPYTSSVTGLTRNRLMRDWRVCNNPSVGCDLSTSTSKYSGTSTKGQPILDWIVNFGVTGLSPKSSGTFSGVYQAVQINLQVRAPDKIESTTISVAKSFNFLTRLKNVSLVP